MASRSEPDILVVGPSRHGVVRYAHDLADALRATGFTGMIRDVDDGEAAARIAGGSERVHVHLTDRLFGSSPEEAAARVERLAAVTRMSVTLHDLPQESDGSAFARRALSYARIIAAADGVVVNSAHEARLIEESLGVATTSVAVIPLGTSGRTPPEEPASVSGDASERGRLRVMIAGYIYPGKGHSEAIHAVATVTARLRASGASSGSGIVVALGAPAPGHDHDVGVLRAEAELAGVDLRVTGYLDDHAYRREAARPGIPVAPHQHISASRTMLDWVELGRRPLVPESRYAREMADLRPGTMTVYGQDQLAERLEYAWWHPESTELDPGIDLRPGLADAASAYRAWWSGLAGR